MTGKWYDIQARGNGVAEILIYGEIGTSWEGDQSLTAKVFVTELNAIRAQRITVRINSFGGSVADGVAIFNALRRHGAHITTEVDGVAVSIASLIAMAGDVRRMAGNSLMMVHAPWGAAAGNAVDMRDLAATLDKHAEVMADAYARGGMDRNEALALLTDGQDHWFTPEEALSAGLIHEIGAEVPIAAALLPARYTPPSFQQELDTMTAPQATPQKPSTVQTPAAPPNAAADIAARNRGYRAIARPFIARAGVQEMVDSAIDNAQPIEEFRAALLRKLGEGVEPLGGGFGERAHWIDTGDTRPRDLIDAGADALLIRAGLRPRNPSPMAQDLVRMGAMGMAERFLSMSGRSVSGMSRSEILAAVTHGTSDFALLLANTAGKALRQGYVDAPGTHALWTGEREVPDFKTQSLVALSAAPDLLEVVANAEYTHGSFGEAAESFAVKTYGRLFSLSRQAIINDDLGAFTNMPMAFGGAARRLEADLVYGKLTANANLSDGVALFHANHGNLAGTGTALSITSLAAARAAMRKQTGVGSVAYIDPQPAFLIVPAELETTAEQLIASLVDPTKSNDTDNPAWVRGLTVIADPRLDADSATAWYLAAHPRQLDTIVRAYIAGEERPYFESKDAFEQDGMSVKSRIDVAAAVIDFRGLYKNPGA